MFFTFLGLMSYLVQIHKNKQQDRKPVEYLHSNRLAVLYLRWKIVWNPRVFKCL